MVLIQKKKILVFYYCSFEGRNFNYQRKTNKFFKYFFAFFKVFNDKEKDIKQLSETVGVRQHAIPILECFRSSIWDETLYKAWSAIVYQLIPNVGSMEQKLKKFADIMDADEVLLFEKATFLVIAQAQRVKHDDVHRFEKVSNIIKQFKLSCR